MTDMLKLAGETLVAALPKMIRLLTVIGTIAMLLVGGGMFVHNIDAVHHILNALPALVAELLTGILVGAVLLTGMRLFKSFKTA